MPEPTKGEVPCCLYVTKLDTIKSSAKLSVELINITREIIGPIAAFRLVAGVDALPRTRSGNFGFVSSQLVFLTCIYLGKTMRKAMADLARNKLVTIPATIEDPTVFSDIKRALQELGYAKTAPDPQMSRKE